MLHGGTGMVAAFAVSTCVTYSVAALAGPQIKGPYLTGLSDAGVVVKFELAAPAAATLQVTREVRGGQAAPSARKYESVQIASMHEVSATGLEPGTAYSYVLRSGGAPIGEGRFVTAPRLDANAPMTFLLYGDDRTDTAAHSAVARAMEKVPSDFLINTGDLVEDGNSDGDWQSFFDIEASLLRDRPLFAAVGNHEIHRDPSGTRFVRYFGFPDGSGTARLYGTARLGNVRFFFLNGVHDWESGEERQWLEGELVRADGEVGLVWRIVVVHDGPWSAGPHGPNRRLVEARVPELLAAHKIDLLLAGHDHTYQRGDAGTIKYIVSGGAGAPLYDITRQLSTTRKALSTYHFVEVKTNADEIRIVARRPDGAEIDRCGLRKGAAWDCDPPPSPPAPPDVPAAPPRPLPSRSGCDVSAANGRTGGAPGFLAVAAVGLFSLSLARRRRTGVDPRPRRPVGLHL
ncbi:MAG: metallophosphoesterase family protein [Polyangiaceae bacterium]